MKLQPRIWRNATALLSAAAVAGAVASMPVGSAQAAAGPSWSALRHDALVAVASVRGDGKVKVTDKGKASAVSSVTSPSGSSVPTTSDVSFVATDSGGSFVVDVSLIQGSQEVVEIVNPATGSSSVVLLAPGTADVAQNLTTTAEVTQLTSSSPPGGAGNNYTVGQGDCVAYVNQPIVIGSWWGPLIDGNGGIYCSYNTELSVIVQLNEAVYGGWKQVSIAGGQSWGQGLFVTTYVPCNTNGTEWYQDWVWVDASGLSPWGGTDTAPLACAPQ